MASIFDTYYRSYNSEIIIDRSNWGTPNNLKLIKKYCPNKPKFILLVRDVLEVLASFIKWSKNNKPNFLSEELGDAPVEVQCDFLMRSDLQIVQEYIGIHALHKQEDSFLITYKQLTETPGAVLKNLYQFLEIPDFKHDLKNLKPLQINGVKYNDSVFGENLHCVKQKIEPSKLDVKSYLPRSVIEKYSDLNFWEQV